MKLSSSRQAPNPLAALLSRPRPVVRIGRVIEMAVLWALVFVCLMVISKVAGAQQKFPIEASGEGLKSRYVQQHTIDVGDTPGHQIRIQEAHRTGHKIVVDGTKVIESWVRGFSNYTNGLGPAWGYSIWVLEDGNKIFLEYAGTSQSQKTSTGSLRGTYHGTTRITGGTGRFSKVRGLMVDTAEFDTDPTNGFNRVSTKGEYWFVE